MPTTYWTRRCKGGLPASILITAAREAMEKEHAELCRTHLLGTRFILSSPARKKNAARRQGNYEHPRHFSPGIPEEKRASVSVRERRAGTAQEAFTGVTRALRKKNVMGEDMNG